MDDQELTEQQITELQQQLVDKRRELLGLVTRESAALGTPTSAQAEYMDGADQAAEVEAHARRASRDGGLLGEIDHALSKFADRSYGVSEDSGEPIPYERLRLVPWARRTVEEEELRARG
jgi:DnaK suppressor protein